MSLYRKRGAGTVRQSLSLSPETQKGLKKIQDAFAVRWPKEKYPTLSAVLEVVLSRNLAELEADPEWLAEEVKEFQRRYQTKK